MFLTYIVKGGFMSTSAEILALIFLSIIADAANVDLANNTTFLLLLLLALIGADDSNNCGCGCSCPNSTLI